MITPTKLELGIHISDEQIPLQFRNMVLQNLQQAKEEATVLRRRQKQKVPKGPSTRSSTRTYNITTCKGCGGPLDGMTKGCPTCWARHGKRRARKYVQNPDHTRCKQCKCPYNKRTKGCRTCNVRYATRRFNERKAKAKLNAS